MAKIKNKQNWLHKKLKLSHHRHTGRRLSHHHTSYGALVCIMILTGLVINYANKTDAIVAQTGNDSISVTGVVPETAKNTCNSPTISYQNANCAKVQPPPQRNNTLNNISKIFLAAGAGASLVWIAIHAKKTLSLSRLFFISH